MIYYSARTGGFYDSAIHRDIPSDVVEITKADRAELLEGQGSGKIIDSDDQGGPVLTDPPLSLLEAQTRFSVLEFRDRFTHTEQLAIRQAQFTDMEVGLVYDSFQAAQYINIEDPRVAAGLDLYEAKGLLEAGRKEELLTPETIQP